MRSNSVPRNTQKNTGSSGYVIEEFGTAEFFDCVLWPNRKPVTGCYEAASAIARCDWLWVSELVGEHELFPSLGKRAGINRFDDSVPPEGFIAAVKRAETLFQACV